MKHHINIDDETMAVLKASDITADSVTLPPGQLARPLYENVNKILVTAGGKWNKGRKAHLFQSDPREALGIAIEQGAIKDVKKATQAFYTPDNIAQRVIQIADIQPSEGVLEPSAGKGALAEAARRAGGVVYCVESDMNSAKHLESLNFPTLNMNFLALAVMPIYDAVVMNPPFTGGQDISHVQHAFKFLTPGGRLVAIVSPSFKTHSAKKYAEFRAFLQLYGEVVEELSNAEFKESGTKINTMIIKLTRP